MPAVAEAAALLLNRFRFWYNPVGYRRPFTQLFLLVALQGISKRRLWFLLPILLIDQRLVVEWTPRLAKILGVELGF